MITRKLEMKENITDGEIKRIEQQLIDWNIHLGSRFEGDDNYFVVEFEDEIDLAAFIAATGLELIEPRD